MDRVVVAIIQARMASSRLPGKVLMDLADTPMLGRVVERTRLAAEVSRVILATSVETSDDAIEAYCRERQIDCFRGSHFDVLDRYYSAARQAGADVMVRITADCPLIDPGLIDLTVRTLAPGQDQGFDLAATRLPPPWKRTFPIGLDVEACTMQALARAWSEATLPEDREHVLPFLYRGVMLESTRPLQRAGVSASGMRVAVLDCEEDLGSQRWTIDTKEDLEFVRQIYAAFADRPAFSWLDVRELLRSRPALLEINAGVHHKSLGDIDSRAGGGAS